MKKEGVFLVLFANLIMLFSVSLHFLCFRIQ
nr:MAG TPA: hypothetical protein [Caudoviricetes sp.]DAQ57086.1 MAG TPA: hypothetical protein [Caudoviricetes sp.]DAT97004.1 MAG TPA: hypothetical protein [Caudoviricetes sp.]DAY48724.1 MAG TPA: hypothetical protein [Caudoviricetes sp.]